MVGHRHEPDGQAKNRHREHRGSVATADLGQANRHPAARHEHDCSDQGYADGADDVDRGKGVSGGDLESALEHGLDEERQDREKDADHHALGHLDVPTTTGDLAADERPGGDQRHLRAESQAADERHQDRPHHRRVVGEEHRHGGQAAERVVTVAVVSDHRHQDASQRGAADDHGP